MAAKREDVKVAGGPENDNGAGATIEKVRELLFGDTSRSIDRRTADIESRIDRLAAEMNERFNKVEQRMAELQAHTEERHLAAIADIGDAIVQLGTSVRSMGASGKKR